MFSAINNISNVSSDSGVTTESALFSPLVNNSVIMKKSLESKFGLSIHQNPFMNDFGGNPLTREIFFIIPDDDLS